MLTFKGDEGLTFSSEYGVGSSFKFFLENKTQIVHNLQIDPLDEGQKELPLQFN